MLFVEAVTEPGAKLALTDVDGAAIRVDITELYKEIRIGGIACDEEVGQHMSGHLHRLRQWVGAEDQDIGSGLDLALIHRPRRNGELRSADGRNRVLRVIRIGEGI